MIILPFKTRVKGKQLFVDCPGGENGVSLKHCRICEAHYGFVIGGVKCMRATLEEKDETN
jgi:hypothetical protein